MAHAEDLFGTIGISNNRKAKTPGTAVVIDESDPNNTVDISTLPLFNPSTKSQFEALRNTLAPIINTTSKKAHYATFVQEFSKQLSQDLSSDQIKKISSSLTALANEKQKAEKAAEKGGKKTKAAKTKTSLVTSRAPADEDTATYEDDAFGE